MDQSAVQQFQTLPTPVKAVVALTSGVGILGTVQLMTGDAAVVGIVAIGIVAVAGLLVGYKFLLGWLRKRKAAPMERAIMDNSSAAPHSISEPARRARLDDLRKSFESGVEKFKAAGKNLYSLPWYLLVGEPGSGKTEAVRHCNVGFPPGLQDQLQGAGGTLNMNWWFTNQAIILDTAGRLMFEDVPPGTTGEWTEFLKMLLRIRPTCPINGMLLVLPADSLLRDKADEIEKKGGKIAQQLDSIQRALGVRFPVFIIITKSDLITGFREYFDTLNDPQLQHQILGWSNPAPLDQPFAPETVENHIKGVSHKLARRRQGLLLDPVHTEDASHRRLDQVDALYAFPESLLQIAPRLRRYLEMIFVAGEWSPKPLFLRGIYFTSSMREGADIDVEVAKILNVAPEALPGGGKVWERDRAFFLRDLFVSKVFREKGLVTRASDTASLQRRRKVAVLGAAFTSVLLLLGLTWWGQRQLDRRVGSERDYWATIDREYRDAPSGKWGVVSPRLDLVTSGPVSLFRYDGDEKTKLPGEIPRAQVHPEIAAKLADPIRVPKIFSLFRVIQGDVEEVRRSTGRSLYEASVLHPLLTAVRGRLDGDRDGDRWTQRSTDALAQLIRLESYAAGAAPAAAGDDEHAPLHLDPLLRYVLDDEEYGAYAAAHQTPLQDSLKTMYVQLGGNWPPKSVAGTPQTLSRLQHDVGAFSAHWKRQIEGRAPRLAAITALADAMDAFQAAEDGLARATRAAPATVADFAALESSWKTHYGALDAARRRADAAIAELEGGLGGWPDSLAALTLFEREVAAVIEQARSAHQHLLSQFPSAKGDASNGDAQELATLRQTVTQSLQGIPNAQEVIAQHALRTRLPLLDQFYLSKGEGPDRNQHRRYVIHFQVYQQAQNLLATPLPADADWKLNTVDAGLRRIDADAAAAVKLVDPVPLRLPNYERVKIACTTTSGMIDFVARARRLQAIGLTLEKAPANKEAFAQAVEAVPVESPVYHGVIPFTRLSERGTFRTAYRPESAAEFLRGWKRIDQLLGPAEEGAAPKVLEPASVAALYRQCAATASQYADEYLDYWTAGLRADLTVNTTWQTFSERSRQVQVHQIMGNLLQVSQHALRALQQGHRSVPPKKAEAFAKALSAAQPPEGAALTVFQNKCETVFSAWQALNADAVRARQNILSLTPAEFLNRHIVRGSGGENQSLAERYWTDMGVQLAAAVARGAQTASEDALRDVRALGRFPLAVPNDDQRPLTVEEVERVRARMAGLAIANLDPRAIDPTIAEGGLTRFDEVDRVLKNLRELELKPSDADLVRRLASLLYAIPATGERFSCSVSILGSKDRDQYKTDAKRPFGNETWLQLALFQGEQSQGIEIADRPDTVSIGQARYPGDPVQFRAKRFTDPNAPFEAHWPADIAKGTVHANWSVLRLLHVPGARRAPDGKQWHVPVPLPDKDKPMVIWVQLDFDRPLPQPRDWPAGNQR